MIGREIASGSPPAPPNSLPTRWKFGEHVAVVGDTGTGKTYLMSRLLRMRQYVVFLRVKPDDITFPGFRKSRTAAVLDQLTATQVLLDPQYNHQMREAYKMLDKVWEQGNWTCAIDEEWYTEQILKLRPMVERMLTQGRSKGISACIGMQRPSQISRFVISQCTHLFVFRIEGRDLQTVKEATTPRIVPAVQNLTGHDFAYFNRKTKEVATGNANQLGKIFIPPNIEQT